MHIFLENESVFAIAQNSLCCSFSSFLCTLHNCNHCFFGVLYVPFIIIESGKWWSRWLLLRRVAFISQTLIKVVPIDVRVQVLGLILYFLIYILSSDRIFFHNFQTRILLVFVPVLDFAAVLYTGKKHGENSFTESFQESRKSSLCLPGIRPIS